MNVSYPVPKFLKGRAYTLNRAITNELESAQTHNLLGDDNDEQEIRYKYVLQKGENDVKYC